MESYRLLKENLKDFIKILKEDYSIVIGPGIYEDKLIYKEINNDADVKLESHIPLKPIKEYLFPQSEKLFNYKKNDAKNQFKEDTTNIKQVFLGLKPCDLTAIKYSDTFFSSNYKDNYYLKRRENTLIIGMSCEYPLNSCYCSSMGVSPGLNNGADIFLSNGGSFYSVEFITEKGKAIENKLKSILKNGESSDLEIKNKINKKTKSLLLEEFNLDNLRKNSNDIYNSNIWKKYSDICITCGACTFDCPTCTCFDVLDKDLDENNGYRYRTWDSCSFYNFCLHASGHNSRDSKVDRLRQRIMHKFNYSVKQFDLWSCVGCGRCIQVCPVGINTRNIVKDLDEESGGKTIG